MSKNLVRATIVLYGTMFLLLLTIPQALLSWTDDLKPERLHQNLTLVAGEINGLSEALGLDRGYKLLRSRFLNYIDQSQLNEIRELGLFRSRTSTMHSKNCFPFAATSVAPSGSPLSSLGKPGSSFLAPTQSSFTALK